MGKLNTQKWTCFMCGNDEKMTADHIGPISLGFVHDPINFQACCSKCNSSKNNRLTEADICKIKSKEDEGLTMISWWAKACWDNCKTIYTCPTKIKNELDVNTKKMLCIIEWCKCNKKDILEEFIKKEYINHDKSYTIKSIEPLSNGNFKFESTSTTSVKKTKSKQTARTMEILLENSGKENRKIKIKLTDEEINYLSACDITTFKSTICRVLETI